MRGQRAGQGLQPGSSCVRSRRQVARAPVVISVYRRERSKLGSISALASCSAEPCLPGKRGENSAEPTLALSLPPTPGEVGPGSRAHAPGDVPTLGEQPEAGSQGRQLPSRGPGVETSFTGVSPPQQTAMTPKPAGPPDGGWGWVVAAAAFAVNGLSYGLLRSLGLALPDLAEHFERSAQDTAWVSALALAVQQAASPVGSALSTRWGARPVVMVGGVLTSLGLVFSAFARSLLHLYLGLGLLAGSGWALVFAPALGTLSRYFSRRRVLAVGLALTGIGGVVQATGLVMMLMSLGGLLGPPLSGFLRDKTGDFSASFLVCSSFILSGSFIYMGLPRALPSCRPASPPATPPPERGELLPVPQVSLLSTGGSSSIRDTTC
ncbi:monocarboxylate transporter 11 isoform X7 [Rattus norvegicus]|uniref:monocarboxylate transporter 11 isoform X7 n=1 Tax=Rattus norvegicus TaxID=10116 RepID=UPI002FD85087